jgi:hypothetical protein
LPCGIPLVWQALIASWFNRTQCLGLLLLQWITNEFLHCGIREAGVTIVERLLNMSRGGILLR